MSKKSFKLQPIFKPYHITVYEGNPKKCEQAGMNANLYYSFGDIPVKVVCVPRRK